MATHVSYYFSIAETILKINLPKGLNPDVHFPAFIPFLLGEETDFFLEMTFTWDAPPRIGTLGELRTDLSIAWGNQFKFFENPSGYYANLQVVEESAQWLMACSKDFRHATVYMTSVSDALFRSLVSWMVMLSFGQASIWNGSILIHASCIKTSKYAAAFLGKSGTGKSTHSKMWLKSFDDTSLLNDDNPAIRIENGKAWIYGTPWSGKTPCYKNEKVLLKALVRLRQAPENKLINLQGLDAFLSILPSCTAIRWNTTLFSKMNDQVQALTLAVKVAQLDCLPQPEAALLCRDSIFNPS
ncbi:hypothetical protein [Sphingobacterium lactis]|uniref:hypothetical protein n=1 Tax=Sphingobacterium lactis TaxID=797291 RepID=UPI003DA4F809